MTYESIAGEDSVGGDFIGDRLRILLSVLEPLIFEGVGRVADGIASHPAWRDYASRSYFGGGSER